MRLSDLLHSRVVDAQGADLGSVDDVRLVQDGPVIANFGAALRVDALIVGRGAIGLRLGYHRAGVKGPWLLKTLFTRLERRAYFVEWDEVDSLEQDVVRLRVAASDLPRVTDV
jgi:sporulation protein YlmC with PRC-barrel domain